MDIPVIQGLIDYLIPFVTPARQERIEHILSRRTRHITVVVEDIFQPHNASAVLRSCDCFGIQDVHIIENKNEFFHSADVSLGSAQWLNLHHYKDVPDPTEACIKSLKDQGYTIYATSPHDPDLSIQDIPIEEPVALMFGTEKSGLTDHALELADKRVVIPMEGFTESFNISVSAALCLFELRSRLNSSQVEWSLPEEYSLNIRLQWIKNSLRQSTAEGLIKKYLSQHDHR